MTSEITLWLESGVGSSREAIKASEGARRLGYHVGWGKNVTDDFIVPVGSVDYCESHLGYSPVPDFYPHFLRDWMHRTCFVQGGGSPCRTRCFAKSATKYKVFPAAIYEPGETLPAGLLWLSDVVEFVQEWRYYVADGCVLTTGWYDGSDDSEPAPELAINWPSGFCGAVDFGRLSDGRIALVECQHPYACGWYGDDHAAFTEWLVEGWRYMTRLTPPLQSANV